MKASGTGSPDIQAELQSALADTTEWMKQNTAAMQEQQLRQLKQSKDIDIHMLTPQEREQWVQAFCRFTTNTATLSGNR